MGAYLSFVLGRARREILVSKQRSFVVIMCIMIGISAIAAIQFYTGSIENHFRVNMKEISGGDIVINVWSEIPEELLLFLAQGEGNQEFEYTIIQETQSFLMRADDPRQNQMVMVQYVDPANYPFYGALGVAHESSPFAGRQKIAEGAVLIDEATFKKLGLAPMDTVRVGGELLLVGGQIEGSLSVTASQNPLFGTVLAPKKESSNSMSHRILLKTRGEEDLEDIARRASLLFEGDDATHGQVSTYKESASQMADVMKVLGDFLMVVGLTSLVLGGLGIYSAVNMMVKQKMKDIAVFRCFGGTALQVLSVFLVQIGVLVLLGVILGLIAGVGLFHVIPLIVKDVFSFKPTLAINFLMIFRITLIGLLIGGLFSILPALSAIKVKPLLLYRQELMESPSKMNVFLAGFVVLLMTGIFGAVISLMIGSWMIGMGFSYGLVVLVALLYLPTRLFVALVCRIPRGRNIAIRLGLGNIQHQGSRATSSVLSIAIGIAAVLLVTLFQVNVVGTLEEMLQDSKGFNIFVMGASLDQSKELVAYLEHQEYAEQSTFTPMAMGSISAINGAAVERRASVRHGMDHLAMTVILGLDPKTDTPSKVLQAEIVEGNWFGVGSGREVVIQKSAAEEAGIRVGDILTLNIAKQEIPIEVIGLFGGERGPQIGMNAAFVMSRFVLEEIPGLEFAFSMVLVRTRDGFSGSDATGDIRRQFPTIPMVIDLGQIFEMVYTIFRTSTRFMQFLGLFSALSGGIILSGMIILKKYQRRKDIAILRCLGGGNRAVLGANFFEYALIGAIAGFLGVFASNVLVYLITTQLMKTDFTFFLGMNVFFFFASIIFAAVIGMLSIADVIGEKPLHVLKHE